MDKKALRGAMLAARAAIPPAERARLSDLIVRAVAESEAFRQAETVMLYRAVGAEADLDALTALPAASGKRFAYPVCMGDGHMEAMVPGTWRLGAYGIPEPDPEGSRLVRPEDIGLVICPCAAFDGGGMRLGMGGGYYDRFLPRCKNAHIALAAFEVQRAAAVPAESWDVGVHTIFTENGAQKRAERS